MSNYPAGVTDNDPEFDMPSGRVDSGRKTLKVSPPKTVMVWCREGQHHWESAAGAKWWLATVETCPEHKETK